MTYWKYIQAVVWGGRILAFLSLFLPFGVFLAAVALMLTEAVNLLQRLARSVEEGGDGG